MMEWVKRHKFLASVLIILFAGMILSSSGVLDGFILGLITGQYILFGWLVKILLFRKKKIKEVK
jgi:uncharacterized membrane protein